jgi:hypothetical protein
VEFNHWAIFHISLLYLVQCLQNNYKCKTVAFYNNCYLDRYININIIKKIKIYFLLLFKKKNFSFYNQLGIEKLLKPKLNHDNKKKVDLLFFNISRKIRNKNDILNIKINNIRIGDLIYDSFLKRYSLQTIDINSKTFNNYLKLFIYLFIYWTNFFKINKKIRAVVVSHSVYSTGVIARIAISSDVKVFVPNINYLYQLNKNKITTDIEFLDFKKKFSKFSKLNKNSYISYGKKELEKRFLGRFNKNIFYSTNAGFKKKTFARNINFNKKSFNVLIAAHSFSDAPHVYGDNLFPDFYEWLDFLGNLSKKTDFNWFIKDGPDYPDSNKVFIKDFVTRFPNIKIIPSNSSHHSLVQDIDLLLTCYGTIAHEYSYFNIPVINASRNNPHINYNFSIHPSNINDYKNKILNAKSIKLKISKNEIFEFVYMRYLSNKIGYFINLNKFFKHYKFKDIYSQEKLYSFFIKNFSKKYHDSILIKLDSFIRSEDYIFRL